MPGAPSTSKTLHKVALDRLSSPEQIDQFLRITPARDWLLLAAVLALLSATVVWGFVGAVTSQTAGRGVIIRAGGVHQILSPAAGRVEAGTPIVSVRPATLRLEALLYIDSADARRIEPGMRVLISPSGVRREDYGFIRGNVASVSEYSATEASMLSSFDNPPLVPALAAGAPVTEVHVEMESDPSTSSGLKWSSPRGAAVRISSGTMISGEIVTDQKAPIDLVIPYLREKFGIR